MDEELVGEKVKRNKYLFFSTQVYRFDRWRIVNDTSLLAPLLTSLKCLVSFNVGLIAVYAQN